MKVWFLTFNHGEAVTGKAPRMPETNLSFSAVDGDREVLCNLWVGPVPLSDNPIPFTCSYLEFWKLLLAEIKLLDSSIYWVTCATLNCNQVSQLSSTLVLACLRHTVLLPSLGLNDNILSDF